MDVYLYDCNLQEALIEIFINKIILSTEFINEFFDTEEYAYPLGNNPRF